MQTKTQLKAGETTRPSPYRTFKFTVQWGAS